MRQGAFEFCIAFDQVLLLTKLRIRTLYFHIAYLNLCFQLFDAITILRILLASTGYLFTQFVE